MRFYYLVLLFVAFVLTCPTKYVARVETIETIYLSSLYEDIHRETPFLAGIKTVPGIKIGHLKTEPPSLALLLGKLGFYELLNEAGLDFIIGDTPAFVLDDMNYFFIPYSMGYAITNYNNIRFAILSQDRDSLTIDDRIRLLLIQQRSDVLWVIDTQVLTSPPKKMKFFIKNRILSDTTTTAIEITPDTELLERLIHIRAMTDELLCKKIYLENKNLKDYVLSTVAQRAGVDVILYPEVLFHPVIEKDSMSLHEILENVACELKFKKTKMGKAEAVTRIKDEHYQMWGTATEANRVLLPDDEGNYLFDLWYALQ